MLSYIYYFRMTFASLIAVSQAERNNRNEVNKHRFFQNSPKQLSRRKIHGNFKLIYRKNGYKNGTNTTFPVYYEHVVILYNIVCCISIIFNRFCTHPSSSANCWHKRNTIFWIPLLRCIKVFGWEPIATFAICICNENKDSTVSCSTTSHTRLKFEPKIKRNYH